MNGLNKVLVRCPRLLNWEAFHFFFSSFYFFLSYFQVPSALIEVSGVQNSSRMVCVLSMQTICCTGARRLVTFVVQVNDIEIRKPCCYQESAI